MMTEKEKELLTKLGECWNDFSALSKGHPSDSEDFVFHIHALQNIVMSRSVMREEAEFFYQEEEDK